MDVHLSPHLSGVLIVGVIELNGVTVRKDNSRWDVIEAVCKSLREEYGHLTCSQIPNVEWARRLYKSVGIDPTKYRPSSEALLRRALKGEPLYQINTLVDAVNWCSLDFLLPIGLYDRDRIEKSVTLRLGMAGESYEGINKGIVHVADRLTAADFQGPFGSPTSDSLRTAITAATTNALALIYAPDGFPTEDLAENVEILAERAQSWCGGEVARTDVVK
jgi:DNA/RNA-binding domain of Phe-tRNA-synthetase-like protein